MESVKSESEMCQAALGNHQVGKGTKCPTLDKRQEGSATQMYLHRKRDDPVTNESPSLIQHEKDTLPAIVESSSEETTTFTSTNDLIIIEGSHQDQDKLDTEGEHSSTSDGGGQDHKEEDVFPEQASIPPTDRGDDKLTDKSSSNSEGDHASIEEEEDPDTPGRERVVMIIEDVPDASILTTAPLDQFSTPSPSTETTNHSNVDDSIPEEKQETSHENMLNTISSSSESISEKQKHEPSLGEQRDAVIIETAAEPSLADVPKSAQPSSEAASPSLLVPRQMEEAETEEIELPNNEVPKNISSEEDASCRLENSETSESSHDSLQSEPEYLIPKSKSKHKEVSEANPSGSITGSESQESLPSEPTSKDSAESLPSDPVSVVSGFESTAEEREKEPVDGTVIEENTSTESLPSCPAVIVDNFESKNQDQETSPRPAIAERVSSDESLDNFISELEGDEKQPASVEFQSLEKEQDGFSSPPRQNMADTPTSVRDFWKFASSSKDSGSPWRKEKAVEKDPALRQAVNDTPLSARRAQLLQASSSQKALERDWNLDNAFSTPIKDRKEAFLSSHSFSLGSNTAKREPLSAERREAFLSASSFARDHEKDFREAQSISERREALFSTNSFSRGQIDDPELREMKSMPLSMRREALLSAAAAQKEVSLSTDDSLKAASMNSMHTRQASFDVNSAVSSAFPIDTGFSSPGRGSGQLNTSPSIVGLSWLESDAPILASSMPLNERRAALEAQGSPLGRKSSLEHDAPIFALSPPVDARRAALQATGGSPSSRKLSESDASLLAASSTPVDTRRAALQAETSSIFRKPFFDDDALESAEKLESRRRTLAERSSPRAVSFEKNTHLPSSPSIDERRAALSKSGTLMSRSATLSFEKDQALLAASNTGVRARQAAFAYQVYQNSLRHSQSLKAELDALKEQSLVSSRRRTLRNRRARADRLFFQIGQKRGGLSDKDFIRVEDFLPRERVILELKSSSDLYDGPNLSFEPRQQGTVPLRVWLASPEEKTFEIVSLDVKGAMTVEEIIEEACNHALDPVLSEQHYVSLCNKRQELVEPTKSIESLLELSPNKRYQTLMAVPFGSTAAMIRAIRRVLEKTDQMKRWLKQPDPFFAQRRREVAQERPSVALESSDISLERRDRKVCV
mmetsp:Transcript_20655/g.43254  ORF Transcript_20655/g.43254 Transcript_20655/m.43254 type:complete len:1151 (-) Transcript_20655:127-3579(-)|eukprot:CAMPEP_0172465368 /NCGR_PEP_ID=MMETSP1065-20121228/53278_1 /TAXON_ID=265537 /ORGANISM="Amphiprora paludosa, Strain CCMP125" /LENGTH=1150 /DNA_ID=CAMNT_0013221877 /DNA_START=82 /DNA_END=3534 /DNA_ORIENTATION=+